MHHFLKLLLIGFQDKQLAWGLIQEVCFPKLQAYSTSSILTMTVVWTCQMVPLYLDGWDLLWHTCTGLSVLDMLSHPAFQQHMNKNGFCLQKLKSR